MVSPDYEDLRVAHNLLKTEQNRSYWESEKVPICPLGRVFLEPVRQLLVFVAPIYLVASLAYYVSVYTIVTTIPLAFIIGRLLHCQLDWSITRKQNREDRIDRGRYYAVRTLSAKLMIPPSAITLKMVEEMARAFEVESGKRAAEKQRLEALRATGKKGYVVQNAQLAVGQPQPH